MTGDGAERGLSLCLPPGPGGGPPLCCVLPVKGSQPRQGLLTFSRAPALAFNSCYVAVSTGAVFVKAQVDIKANLAVLK